MSNNSGFSLMELMVVVGIIAVLSLVAIPSYKGYQAKSRRVEGMNLLNGYYTAAHASRAEHGYFPGNFVQTDYQPRGTLGYRLRVIDGRDIGILINDDNCIATVADCDCNGTPVPCPNFKTWEERAPMGVIGAQIGPYQTLIPCPPLAPLGLTADTFSIRVAAVVSLTATRADRLGMNERKQIQVCESGIQ